jgi:hypothetical protein
MISHFPDLPPLNLPVTLPAEFHMSSRLKKDTARANGAKSRGPVTPEGRARSSANSRTHGLTSTTLLLPGESKDDFNLLLADYVDQFRPASGVEMELVESMVSARWRLRRLLAMETNLFDTEIVRRSKAIDKEFTGMDDSARLAWVFQKLADNGQVIALLIRYETTINRSYDRAFKQLQMLQASKPAPPPPQSPANSEMRNEPNAEPKTGLTPTPLLPHYNERQSTDDPKPGDNPVKPGQKCIELKP